MARPRLDVDILNDYTGGLTLRPQQEMAVNECYIAKNVDFSVGGGISTRRAVRPYVNTVPAGFVGNGDWLPIVIAHVHHRVSDGLEQLFAGAVNGGMVAWTDGHNWFDTFQDYTRIDFKCPVGAQYGDNSYFQDGLGMKFLWNGIVATTLGSDFDENIAAPTGSNMPTAKCVASKGDFFWVANTIETDGGHPRRVRWSHPGRPTSWRSLDFIEVPEGEITALVPFQDYLMVFTNEQVFGVYGTDTETFSLQTIDADTGTPWPYSVTVAPAIVYWWDWDRGMMGYRGGNVFSIFDKLKPGLDQGIWNVGSDSNLHPYVGWGAGRLYVGIPTTLTDQIGSVLVFDPAVGESGAWTSYDDLGRLEGLTVIPVANEADVVVTGGIITDYPVVLNDPRQMLDKFGPPGTTNYNAGIGIHFATSWFEGSANVTRKRWRRPRTSWHVGGTQDISYRWNKDYARKTIADFGVTDFNVLSFVDPQPVLDPDVMIWSGHADATAKLADFDSGTGTTSAVSGSVTTQPGDFVCAMGGSWDAGGLVQTASFSTTLTGLTDDLPTQLISQAGGGRSAAASCRTWVVTGAGSTGTVTLTAANADNCAINVFVLRNVGGSLQIVPRGGGGISANHDQDMTAPIDPTGMGVAMIAIAENAAVTIAPDAANEWTEQFENNGAGFVFQSQTADPSRFTSKWDTTGTSHCWAAMLLEVSTNSDLDDQSVWNAYEWGGSVLEAHRQFTEFETITSPGVANVVSLEVRFDKEGDPNWDVDFDSLGVPYREKGFR